MCEIRRNDRGAEAYDQKQEQDRKDQRPAVHGKYKHKCRFLFRDRSVRIHGCFGSRIHAVRIRRSFDVLHLAVVANQHGRVPHAQNQEDTQADHPEFHRPQVQVLHIFHMQDLALVKEVAVFPVHGRHDPQRRHFILKVIEHVVRDQHEVVHLHAHVLCHADLLVLLAVEIAVAEDRILDHADQKRQQKQEHHRGAEYVFPFFHVRMRSFPSIN